MRSFPDTALAYRIADRINLSRQEGWYELPGVETQLLPCITFHEYMEACLYDETYGYYRTGEARVGKEGDFYTSSAIGSIMSEIVSRYALTFQSTLGLPVVLTEWGAGTGRLSAGIAASLRKLTPQWESRFSQRLIEDHPGHRAKVKASYDEAGLPTAPPVYTSREYVMKRESREEQGAVLVIANELLDAFPVHRIIRKGETYRELGVAESPGHGFVYAEMPLSDAVFLAWLERDGICLRDGQITELCPGARDWLLQLGRLLHAGDRVMLIDYGHEAEEYAAEHRMQGTLMTYSRHQASDSPFLSAGERDITAHVSFSFIRSSAEEAGFRVDYYDTQKQFLLDNDIFELLGSHDGSNPFGEEAKRNRAVRQLLLSDGMSESFKVMIVEKT
ncbi:SAM-dependent methyltransferase [Paenibacillus sp. 1011MAR3C5]|uniref:class I SAM-dependent methyltransferase n=1 Tax=Paenibacillus sp. 1011MAR3C5 TaxID=1675787 RepID=UPI000E6D2744|nr:SAM-dependent methyltransferase [Paenibacillus sp. 1011MAR3C5]RJE90785.1 SAM-dependent methyltransferase [Paenibacillus sp. 1011MAR3C5]